MSDPPCRSHRHLPGEIIYNSSPCNPSVTKQQMEYRSVCKAHQICAVHLHFTDDANLVDLDLACRCLRSVTKQEFKKAASVHSSARLRAVWLEKIKTVVPSAELLEGPMLLT